MAHSGEKNRKKNAHGPSLPSDQKLFRRIYRCERRTWLPEVKTGRSLKPNWKAYAKVNKERRIAGSYPKSSTPLMFRALAQKFLAKPRSTLAFEHASSCCFNTSTNCPVAKGFHGTTWVVKRYLKETSKDILAIGQAIEEYTKKVVQMHCLAQNFAAKL